MQAVRGGECGVGWGGVGGVGGVQVGVRHVSVNSVAFDELPWLNWPGKPACRLHAKLRLSQDLHTTNVLPISAAP